MLCSSGGCATLSGFIVVASGSKAPEVMCIVHSLMNLVLCGSSIEINPVARSFIQFLKTIQINGHTKEFFLY